ncbi:hypothetical protein C8F04DRAFT_960293, partial [Mycena alexandri]
AVCQTWRDIALGTPALWATLALRFDLIDRAFASEPGNVDALADRWLQRAAPLPLSILFSALPQYSAHSPPAVTPLHIRNIIHKYAHMIQYLQLNMSMADLRQTELNSVNFPLLRRAAFVDHDDEESPPDPIHSLIFVFGVFCLRRCPRLRELFVFDGGILSSTWPVAAVDKI